MSEGKVSSGIEGLDDVIGGGFPRGSLILLAGNPGTGKTIFAAHFLHNGASKYGESGVYASFAEGRDVFVKNMRSFGLDFDKLEKEGKVKILDLLAVKEAGLPTLLEIILSEVRSINAKRLVIDSFTAIVQAFREPIDTRIVLHTILSKIVRQLGCTTIIITEIPVGRSEIGVNVEEFVADNVLVLHRILNPKVEDRMTRELEVLKMRGTEVKQPMYFFTLRGGFKVFPPFRLEPIKERRRFQPIPDTETRFSTGCPDLDEMIGGGYPKGDIAFIEIGENVSVEEWMPLLCSTVSNFLTQGRGVIMVPPSEFNAKFAFNYCVAMSGMSPDEVSKLFRCAELLTPAASAEEPSGYRILVEGRSMAEDYQTILRVDEELTQRTGQPILYLVDLQPPATIYGIKHIKRFGTLAVIRSRKKKDLFILFTRAGLDSSLRTCIANISQTHLKLVREHGTILLYAEKPRSGVYVFEVDTSKGYPLPKLTPIT